MIVEFTTAGGARYRLDHSAKVFTQLAPQQRTGSMFNAPAVRIGQRVEIQTSDSVHPLRVIQTGFVTSREVYFV